MMPPLSLKGTTPVKNITYSGTCNLSNKSNTDLKISGLSTYQTTSDSDSDKNMTENTYLELRANSRFFGGRHSLARLTQSLKKTRPYNTM